MLDVKLKDLIAALHSHVFGRRGRSR